MTELLDYRLPFDADGRRSIADIPLAELAAVVVANQPVLDQSDPALDLARLLALNGSPPHPAPGSMRPSHGRGCI